MKALWWSHSYSRYQQGTQLVVGLVVLFSDDLLAGSLPFANYRRLPGLAPLLACLARVAHVLFRPALSASPGIIELFLSSYSPRIHIYMSVSPRP